MSARAALIDKGRAISRVVPGVALSVTIAATALTLRQIPSVAILSTLSIAVLIGMVLGNVWRIPAYAQPGIVFAGRNILRFAIILLGFQLSLTQVAAIGIDGLVVVILAVGLTFLVTLRAAVWLGVDPKLAQLIAAGTSVCGASAVVAMNSVSEAPDEDVIYALGAVTVFGTILMFLLPLLASLIGLDSRQFGIWAGSSIHEIAQVTGASFQFSDTAGEAGIIVKLTRVLTLAPLILGCLFFFRRGSRRDESATVPAFPLFVIGFVAAVVLNTLIGIPASVRAELMTITGFLMAVSLAALGVQTHLGKLKAKGLRPLALGATATLLIVGFTLALIEMFGWLA